VRVFPQGSASEISQRVGQFCVTSNQDVELANALANALASFSSRFAEMFPEMDSALFTH
jgi:hypothetical protein